MPVDAQQLRVFLEQLVGHHDAGESVNVVPQAAHGFAEQPPERSRPLAVRYAKVDRVRERPTPVDLS